MPVGPIAAARRRSSGVVTPLSDPLDLAGCSFWHDYQDISTLFQDTAATTPVTATSQAIARVNDKSGNGRNVEQGTAGTRPTYIAVGGSHAAQFDGSNDCLQNALTNIPVSTVFAAAIIHPAGSDPYSGLLTNLTDQGSGVDLVWVGDDLETRWLVAQGTGAGLADASHYWVNGVQTNDWADDAMAIYIADGTGHSSPVLPTGMNVGLDRNVAGRYSSADIFEMFAYDTILSPGDRARAELYLANRYGVILP